MSENIKPSEVSEVLLQQLKGMEGTSISGGTNIAIYNTHRRLQVLYGADYGLTYSSDVGKGTEVQIRIPAKRDETSGETPKPL